METQTDNLAAFGITIAEVPTACSEHAQPAHTLTRDWANSFGLLGDPRQQRKFDQLGYTQLLAYGCLTASAGRLALFAQWFTYYFLLDDQQDLAVLTGRDDEFIALQDDIRQILHAQGKGGGDRPGLRGAVADLCRRTAGEVSGEWWHRYVTHAEEVFAAQRLENGYRLTGRFPDPDAFKKIRREAGAADMVFDIIEAAEDLEIPAQLRGGAACRQYADDLNDFTTWTNDVLGVDHDAANDDPNNYVLVRQQAGDLSREAALESVNTEIARLVHGLGRRKHDVLAAAQAHPAAVRMKVDRALTAWHDWAMNVPIHYLRANGRLWQMDEAAPRQPPAFAEDLL